MGGNAKTTLYLKECMADALIKLLDEKPLDKITVPEITDLAGVGRVTYFRNCLSKEELISFKLMRLEERWKAENMSMTASEAEMDRILIFFRFHSSIQKLLKLIYKRDLQFTVYFNFYQTLVDQTANEIDAFKSRFFAYGVLGLLDEWIRHDFQETPEEMTEMVHRFGRFEDKEYLIAIQKES